MKRTMMGSMALLLALAAASVGCSGANGGEGGASGEGTPSATPESKADPKPAETPVPVGPIKITMMNLFTGETAPKDDSPDIKAVEEFTGVDLEVTWVPENVYAEKLSVTLASGEMPQAILAHPLDPTILNAVESGMFWELDPFLDEFPNLKTFNPVAFENSTYKGKTYSIIRPRPVSRGGVIIRKDWLERVGLQEPATLDELYGILVAFKDRDPDADGKHDTYGLMQYDGYNRDVFVWAGAPNNWKVENGKFVKDAETPEYIEGMKFLKKLYDEGLTNPSFAIEERNVARKDLYTGKVGASIEAFDAVVPFYSSKVEEFGAEVEFTVAAPINGRSRAGQGYHMGFFFPKSSVKTEEELRGILRYFDAQRSPEVVEKFTNLLVENAKKPEAEQFNVDNARQILVSDTMTVPFGDSAQDVMIREKMEANNAAAVGDPSLKLVSPTNVERGGELNTMLVDATTKFILGELDEAGFGQAVEQWKQAGGAKVAEEFAAQYTE